MPKLQHDNNQPFIATKIFTSCPNSGTSTLRLLDILTFHLERRDISFHIFINEVASHVPNILSSNMLVIVGQIALDVIEKHPMTSEGDVANAFLM
jgi:hypothetical protein